MLRASILALCTVAVLAACRSPVVPPPPPPPPVLQVMTLQGTVIPNPEHQISPAIVLLEDDGTQIGLYGTQANAMVELVNQLVQVSGTQIEPGALEVSSYIVLSP